MRNFWEAQALTKARALCGSEAQALNAAVAEIWRRWSAHGDLSGESGNVPADRQRTCERGRFSHFKTGKGGLIGIEFLVQYLQMKHQVQETNTLNAIGKLAGVLDPGESVILRATYGFLRRIESVLRRVSNSSISQLPPSRRTSRTGDSNGFPGKEDFLEEYTSHRDQAERIIQEHLG